MWCALPALAVIGLWLVFQDAIILRLVVDHLPAGVRDLPANELSLVMNDVRNLIAGNVPAESVSESVRVAAAEYIQLARHQPHGAHRAGHGDGDRAPSS